MKKIITFTAIAFALAALVSSCCCKNGQDYEQRLQIGDNIAVAQTQYGKVRGYISRDVFTFLGVPYGATTAGENRFMPPQEPKSWNGIRNAVFYGYVAPQNMDNKYPNAPYTFSDHWNYGTVDEDCLSLNVWTPALDGAKRPVMVWFHGGGFTSGNAIEQDGYNGENFSRKGDVVFVSVNHRLGAIGYTDFSEVDPKYANSGNAGALDMVAALKWVHNNIENFGGDPSNVTVMGQSGGGSKVCILAAMPETKGMVSKVVALSGNSISSSNKENTKALGKFIYEKAGKDMSKILAMGWREYLDFAAEASREFAQANPGMRAGFSPVSDGVHIPEVFFEPGTPSNDIPMIICSCTAEHPIAFENSELTKMSWDEAAKYLEERSRVKDGKATVNAYRAIFPDKKPFQIVDVATASRAGVIRTANKKSAQDAPVYVAWFDYNSHLWDGRRGSFHCMDICFWYKNTDLMVTHSGGTKEARELSDKMSEALLNFMRTGNPNGVKGLPEWPAYTEENGATMIFNTESRALLNADTAARATMQ